MPNELMHPYDLMSYTPVAHTHASIRLRNVHPLLIWAAFRLGLQRLVVVYENNLPHDRECTDSEGVLRA